MSEKSIFEQAVECWGPVSQVGMVNEEAGELFAALNHWRRGRGSVARVAEELADLSIVLDQLSYVIASGGIDPEKFTLMVGSFREQKLVRLQGLLQDGQADHWCPGGQGHALPSGQPAP